MTGSAGIPDPAAAPAPAPARAGRAWLWTRLRAERRKAEELHRRAVWLQAELENVRKQAERERAQAGEAATQRLLASLLPVLDSLDHGLAAHGPEAQGLGLVRRELERALGQAGLQPIAALGQPFDPALHEAAQRSQRPCAPGEAPGLVVAQELRRGYTARGRVLRPAMVHVVERMPPAAEPQGPGAGEGA